jgi:hypothetical protein
MLINLKTGQLDLMKFPGRVMVYVWLAPEDFKGKYQGETGVWYEPPDKEMEIYRLNPVEVVPDKPSGRQYGEQALYWLRPMPVQKGEEREGFFHRWLIQEWNNDLRFPTVVSTYDVTRSRVLPTDLIPVMPFVERDRRPSVPTDFQGLVSES